MTTFMLRWRNVDANGGGPGSEIGEMAAESGDGSGGCQPHFTAPPVAKDEQNRFREPKGCYTFSDDAKPKGQNERIYNEDGMIEPKESAPVDDADIAEYIADTLAELRLLAAGRGMQSLAVLLELAARDAESYAEPPAASA